MDVKLPPLGEGVDSGVVVSIQIKEGDSIQEGQTILELENEKAVAPIPSPVAGKVTKIPVKQGEKLSVGQVILSVAKGASAARPSDAAKGKPAKTAASAEEPSAETPPEPEPARSETAPDEAETEPAKSQLAPAASPSTRKIAYQLGIDLRKVRGSERGGRVVMADLRAYIQGLQSRLVGTQAGAPTRTAAAPAAPVGRIDFSQWGDVTKKPLSTLRKTIGRRMLESWTTIPQVTQFDEADVTAVMELRKQYATAYESKGTRLTLTGLALKVVSAALKKFPDFNCSLDEAAQELVFKAYYHIGVAVDTEAGLIVPVIRDVDRKDLVTLSKELNELAEKARQRKVSLEDLKGGSFTISNQGGIGGAHFTPIINKPEVAILGLGRGAWKPVVKNGKIETRTMLPLALSYDHRVIDGGQAAGFITEIVQGFENFREEEVRI